uniref:Uncharacterized protein n=1 Tax=Picea sitchensis TaxID=3332 RepID=A9NNR3_PICSI|nr:unknown [Picea sitchensis]
MARRSTTKTFQRFDLKITLSMLFLFFYEKSYSKLPIN